MLRRVLWLRAFRRHVPGEATASFGAAAAASTTGTTTTTGGFASTTTTTERVEAIPVPPSPPRQATSATKPSAKAAAANTAQSGGGGAVGRPRRLLQVAVVGAGPSGFYVAQSLLKRAAAMSKEVASIQQQQQQQQQATGNVEDAETQPAATTLGVHIDIFERLPVPHGLVRYGVAPDHPEVKNCIQAFDEVMSDKNVTFLGNIELGRDIFLHELQAAYSCVVLTTGAGGDNTLGIPGERMAGVISARRFVDYYNTMPMPYAMSQHCPLDLADGKGPKRIMIIGNGNVALDCARVLTAHYKHFCATDMNCHAVRELMRSSVRHVDIVARRGPSHAAFTIKELRELMALPNVRVGCEPFDLDEALAGIPPQQVRAKTRQLQLLHTICCSYEKMLEHDGRTIYFRFGLTPVRFLGKGTKGQSVIGCAFRRSGAGGNAAAAASTAVDQAAESAASPSTTSGDDAGASGDDAGNATRDGGDEGSSDEIIMPCDGAIVSTGFYAEPLREVPFDKIAKRVPHVHGRVLSASGVYCSGWCCNGAKGVIVNSLMEAKGTAEVIWQDAMSGLQRDEKQQERRDEEDRRVVGDGDAGSGGVLGASPLPLDTPGKFGIVDVLVERKVLPVTTSAVRKIFLAESKKGIDLGKKAEKMTAVRDMLDLALGGRVARRAANRFVGEVEARPKGLELLEDWLDDDTRIIDMSDPTRTDPTIEPRL